MDLENLGEFSLLGLGPINVILGKNGCGKSHLLKNIVQPLKNRVGNVRYLVPERGGTLTYEPGIANQIANDPNWLGDNRRQNQSSNFRQQSATLFRELELLVLREIEAEHGMPGYVRKNFQETIDKVNALLDRVFLERHIGRGFIIRERATGNETNAIAVSSGEAELISIAIEVLAFVKAAVPERDNFLLIDEPDVHLHPDLQEKLASFLITAIERQPVTLIVATHSTALLAGLARTAPARVAFMRHGDTGLEFQAVTEVDQAILPIFGAHPLSNVFNQAPILLVEGDDDARIWQQAVRSSNGQVRLYPCPVESVDRLMEYEREVNKVLAAVYDQPLAYSLRDRDDNPEIINDEGTVSRLRLSCRAAENLIVTNDVLALVDANWADLQRKIQDWLNANPTHKYHDEVRAFVEGGFDRKASDLKPIRNVLIGLVTNKPWEVIVGQAIAKLVTHDDGWAGDGSLRDFLGEKVCDRLLHLEARR